MLTYKRGIEVSSLRVLQIQGVEGSEREAYSLYGERSLA